MKLHQDPVEPIHVPKIADSSTLMDGIKDSQVRPCLLLSCCCGQAYDGAANMSGHLTGVAAQIQKDVPSALFVHCFAHCTFVYRLLVVRVFQFETLLT